MSVMPPYQKQAGLAAMLALCAGMAVSSAQAAGTACVNRDHCPIKIVNGSKVFANSQIWILASGQNDAYTWPDGTACQGQTAANLICPTGYVKFDANGIGTLETAQAGGTSLPYAVSINNLPADPADPSGNTRILQMPRHGSGRIFVTVGNTSVTTSVIGSAPPLSISSPSISSNQDPNFYMLYDKFETSYLHDTAQLAVNPLYIDLTSVDFVSLPLSLSLEIPGQTASSVGYLGSRGNLFSTLAASLNDGVTQNWQALLQSYQGTPLRVIAPNDAIQSPYLFDAGYFSPYIASVWSSYAQTDAKGKPLNTLTIDASEVLSKSETICAKPVTPTQPCIPVPLRYTGSVIPVASVADCAPDTAATTASCITNYAGYPAIPASQPNLQVMCFKQALNANGSPVYAGHAATIPVLTPSTFDMIGGAGALCAPDATARAVIAKDLSAMLNRGLLPIGGATLVNDNDTSATGFWPANQGNYYTSISASGKPNYNLYAHALHTLSTGGIYAFAFDDVGGQSSTLVDDGAVAAVVTLNDMTGTALPDPKSDGSTYDVTLSFPVCQAITLNGATVTSGQYFKAQPSPLNLVWNGQPLAIYPGTGVMSPAAVGTASYNIALLPGQGANGSLQISFPSQPSPWPGGNAAPSGIAPQVSLTASSTDGKTAHLQFALYANGSAGLNADWYLVINTAKDDWLWYNATGQSWTASPKTTPLAGFTGALASTGCLTVPAPTLPAGSNTFYFGVDTTTGDGKLNPSTLVYTSAVLSLSGD